VLHEFLHALALPDEHENGDTLSAGDVRGLRLLYPELPQDRIAAAKGAHAALVELEGLGSTAPTEGLKQILDRLAGDRVRA